jgi:hypothetical protein
LPGGGVVAMYLIRGTDILGGLLSGARIVHRAYGTDGGSSGGSAL